MTVSETSDKAEPAVSEPAPAALPPPESKWSESPASAAPPPQTAPIPPPDKDRPVRRGLAQGTTIAILAVMLGLSVAVLVIKKFGPSDASQVAQLRSEIEDLRSQSAGLTALGNRLQALEKQGAGAGAGDPALAARLAAVEQSMSTLNSSISALQSGSGAAAPGASPPALDEIKTQLTQLAARIDTLEKSLGGANSALGDRIGALEQKIPANLSDQLSGAATKTQVDALGARVATLEASTTALDAKRAAAAIALANLARAAQSGSKFTDELAAVRLLDVDQSTLAPIAPFAERGVKPVSDLVAAFDGSARAALRASRGAAGDWWSRFWANLSSLFLVRRTGAMSGNSDEAILARAGDDVRAGNLQAALGEVSRLSAPAAKEMASWQADAKARVELDRLVGNATSVLIANLASVPAH